MAAQGGVHGLRVAAEQVVMGERDRRAARRRRRGRAGVLPAAAARTAARTPSAERTIGQLLADEPCGGEVLGEGRVRRRSQRPNRGQVGRCVIAGLNGAGPPRVVVRVVDRPPRLRVVDGAGVDLHPVPVPGAGEVDGRRGEADGVVLLTDEVLPGAGRERHLDEPERMSLNKPKRSDTAFLQENEMTDMPVARCRGGTVQWADETTKRWSTCQDVLDHARQVMATS